MVRVRVCLIAGHPLAACYISQLASRERDFEVVEEQDFQKPGGAAPRRPDVFLIDASAENLDLAQRLRVIRVRYPKSRIILLGPALEPADFLRHLYFGIQGYVPFRDVPHKLAGAIRAVHEGGCWLPPRLLADYIKQNEIIRAHRGRHPALTKREQQILGLVVRRLSNKEIAEILKLSERTVKFHISNLFSKLEVHGRRNLIEEFAPGFQPA